VTISGAVPDHHQQDGDHRQQLRPADVETQQRDDADDAEPHARQPDGGQPLLLAGQAGRQRRHEGHRGDQQAGQRAGQRLLGVGEQQPRAGHLQHREGQQGPPVAQRRAHLPPGDRPRQQQCGTDEAAGEDDGHRRDLLDRHLDEQVRNAPDHRHRQEQRPAPPAHRRPPAASPTRSS
jgi:hypothetical protein